MPFGDPFDDAQAFSLDSPVASINHDIGYKADEESNDEEVVQNPFKSSPKEPSVISVDDQPNIVIADPNLSSTATALLRAPVQKKRVSRDDKRLKSQEPNREQAPVRLAIRFASEAYHADSEHSDVDENRTRKVRSPPSDSVVIASRTPAPAKIPLPPVS